ncbi:CinY protein [Trichosporon asahii var. asahii CBS 2479]|uniref:CinY protein n=1 Tax=Trichosporon asahii var. asahii (strain ATCC 90039 / CBS 2479 / JCM 2466 / KCTC 7840 / NBRC 103889/ NCYC 2677 / UAMH 7654) TaxID=1186058 RepID=J6ENK2_TRIAS|nr:CinY protein [Trichosporon asahii var. asahii CBS 2479]EJT45944.1 CinY protein [Trichosporon asahii var. asahii CBS 2479]
MVAALLLLAPSVAAFGTINTGGQQAEHERITRIALQCPDGVYHDDGSCFEPISMLSFAGGNGTFGAVGAPDGGADTLKSQAHCDDADYIDYAKWGLNGTYPQSKAERNRKLRECYEHLKGHWDEGIKGAAELVDDYGALVEKEAKLADENGKGIPCVYSGSLSGRAKCDAFEGLGRSLHGLQDFYSHSNWVDYAQITPTQNTPPGLGMTDLAPFLSMTNGSGPSDTNVPSDFSTGCFILFGHDTVEGAAACEKDGRYITHVVLNKDKGEIIVKPLANITIDAGTTLTGEARTPRGNISDNFERAVHGAVLESRRQWADFRQKLIDTYGPTRGRLMICALTRDQPQRDCGGGRSVALVLDGSSAAGVGDALKNKTQSTDRVGVFDGRGAFSAFGSDAKLESLQGGSLANGLRLAVDTLNGTKTDHIVLVSSEDSADVIEHVQAAKKKGIRVSYGLLTEKSKSRRSLRFWRRADPPQTAVAAAVLSTGGTYAVLADSGQKGTFAQHVFAWDEGSKTNLPRGLIVFDDGDRDWSHQVEDKRNVNVTVTAYNGSATAVLREDDKERARGKGSTVSLQAQGDDSTVEARVEPDGLYSIALDYTSAAIKATSSLVGPVAAVSLAYLFL